MPTRARMLAVLALGLGVGATALALVVLQERGADLVIAANAHLPMAATPATQVRDGLAVSPMGAMMQAHDHAPPALDTGAPAPRRRDGRP